MGHRSETVEAQLAAAVLYAGPGAMLSHATAAWWFGLVDDPPRQIEVSTPRRCRSRAGIRVHQRRHSERIWRRGLPVTPIQRTLLEYASSASLTRIRLALARAEYQDMLNPVSLQACLCRGQPGAAKLRQALARHLPRLAWSRSRLETAFMELCEAGGLPLPELNARVAGWTVDAVWREQGIVVELDGWRNHRTPAQVDRDRRKEMDLRRAGLLAVRYSGDQVSGNGQAVTREMLALHEQRALPTSEPSEPHGVDPQLRAK